MNGFTFRWQPGGIDDDFASWLIAKAVASLREDGDEAARPVLEHIGGPLTLTMQVNGVELPAARMLAALETTLNNGARDLMEREAATLAGFGDLRHDLREAQAAVRAVLRERLEGLGVKLPWSSADYPEAHE